MKNIPKEVLDALRKKVNMPEDGEMEIEIIEIEPLDEEESDEMKTCPHCGMSLNEEPMEKKSEMDMSGLPEDLIKMMQKGG